MDGWFEIFDKYDTESNFRSHLTGANGPPVNSREAQSFYGAALENVLIAKISNTRNVKIG